MQWPLCDELPKEQPIGLSAGDAIDAYAPTGGIRVDTGGPCDADDWLPGEPHLNAHEIARAIWQLDKGVQLDLDREKIHGIDIRKAFEQTVAAELPVCLGHELVRTLQDM